MAINGETVVAGALGNDALGNPDPVVNQGSAYIIFSSCNTAPTITAATAFTRKQGTPAALATLATVTDFQNAAGSLAVTATSIPSGVTLSGLTNSSGTITALVAAACDALIGAQSITLQVTELTVGQGVVLGAGHSYRWWDDGIADCGSRIADCRRAAYWLEDVDLNGHSTWHGPFVAVASGDKQRPASVEQAKLLASLVTSERDSAAVEPRVTLIRAASVTQVLPPIASGNQVKIAIEQTGWYRLTQTELIAAGLDPAVDPRRLQLFVDGRELAISVAGESDGDSTQAMRLSFTPPAWIRLFRGRASVG